jgi:hypothetical protein
VSKENLAAPSPLVGEGWGGGEPRIAWALSPLDELGRAQSIDLSPHLYLLPTRGRRSA